MPAGELAALDQRAHLGAKPQQAQRVRDRRARLADARRDVLLRHVIAVHQLFVALGLLQRVEVLALQILDERQLRRLAVVRLDDDGGNLGQAREPRGAPAALARDDLIIAGAEPPHGQRLQDAVLADRVRQLVERRVVEALARLVGVALDLRDGEALQIFARIGAQRRVAQQRAEALAKPMRCVSHVVSPLMDQGRCHGFFFKNSRANASYASAPRESLS